MQLQGNYDTFHQRPFLPAIEHNNLRDLLTERLKLAKEETAFARRDPTTDRHGGFDLLRLRPGPVHPSLDDLAVPGSPRNTISIPNLVRTPDRHSPLQPRTPELKRSASLSLPVAWITGARHCTRRELRVSAVLLNLVLTAPSSVKKHNTAMKLLWRVNFIMFKHLQTGCTAVSIHRRDPTTDRHGGFDLLRLRPGPVHPSLDDLVVPGSPRSTISIPNLVRTPDRHSPLQPRTPELKRSASLSLPVAWITGARHCTRRELRVSALLLNLVLTAPSSPWCRISATTSQSHNELSLGRAISVSIALNVNEEEKGGARRDPTTDRHGGFDLLRLRPGPVHPSLDDLVVPGSPRSTISIPNLVRTPDRHSPLQPRTPELKRSASLSLPAAWITGARHCTRRELRVSAVLLNLVLTAPSSLEAPGLSHGRNPIGRDPTTDRHGGFDLLRLRPGPIHPSLDDLVVPGSPRSTISIPNLVRTPDRHSPLQPRTPELKRSASLSLPVAWITGARHCTRRELRVSALLLNLVLTAPSSVGKHYTILP
ncbi:hypothetical protein QQF64_003623 [Cirrhinus molitorella]|uniref:Uncharacterized protein n=1 Tax=Cirrhinus molitorella TaxID=172907 RepID=A0ABR3MLU8_9TELE